MNFCTIMKKLYVFDLDDTLYIDNNLNESFEYNKKIKDLLSKIKQSGSKIAVLTYNITAKAYIQKLGLESYIDLLFISAYVLDPEQQDTFVNNYKHIIKFNRSYLYKKIYYIYKSHTIQYLLEKADVLNHEVIFFDDDITNVYDVLSKNIESIHVLSSGIDFESIYKNKF